MKKIKIGIITLLLTLFVSVLNVNASSFSVSVSNKNITKGGSTKLTISGSDVIGRFNIKSSNSGVVSISEDRAWIENNSYTITLYANSVGSSTITITPADVSNGSGGNPGLSAKSINVTVSLPREKSNNNDLKSISVDGYELVPVFDKNTLEYNVSVPSTVEKVTINATKADNYSKVSGTGEFEVVEGSNAFEIICTSETGKEKVYLVNVTVEDLNPIEVTVDNKKMTVAKSLKNIEMPANYEEKSVSINGITIPSYYNQKADITLVGLKDESGNLSLYKYDNKNYEKYIEIISGDIQFVVLSITNDLDGYIRKNITINESSVNALMVNEKSKFAVLYGINVKTGKEGYYTYDINNKSIQEYDSEMIDLLNEKNQNYFYIIIILSGILVISLLLIIILACSNSKKNKLMKKFILKHENKNNDVENNEEKKEEHPIIEVTEESNNVPLEKLEEKTVEETPKNKKGKQKKEKKEEKIETEEENSIVEVEETTDDTEEVYNLFDEKPKRKNKKRQ